MSDLRPRILETDRLILRGPSPEDVAPMFGFLKSDHSRFYGGPMTDDEAWRKLTLYAGQWALRGYGLFSVYRKPDMAMIGMAGPYHPAEFPEPELSWLVVGPEFEGQGLAREACQAVLTHLFSDLGWASVVSFIDAANHRSRVLAERLGAQLDPGADIPLENCDAYRHQPKTGVAQ
ncbi:GNAT family N-acetyltransferase [Ruegeria sp. 2012CJ41-6]|uniref:GNAT family N-acetyltransferase n=1 Tax=Ruegeria spongiae TaxID=2942209 RepID=A0ABT0Q3T0_9RHOB|nr:GNAT family N-acetyltransferase [Ruegeria spongiae]MCL6284531.1 GNAT family N-acetyltransferase [Ruegeria spongiae]